MNITVRIIETGELKSIPKPFAIRWKERLGKIRWNPIEQIYEITERQYNLEIKGAQYNRLIGILCFILIAGVIALSFMGK